MGTSSNEIRVDPRIHDLLNNHAQADLVERGSDIANIPDLEFEEQPTFMDELCARLEYFAAEYPEHRHLIQEPAVILGATCVIGVRREDMSEAEILASVRGAESSI